MANKKQAASELTEKYNKKTIRLDYVYLTEFDFEWLENVERLTLFNVDVPDGFLTRLPNLWWLDLRGGSANDIRVARGCQKLRYLQINQVRGFNDLSEVENFNSLELLSLYGLAKLVELPDFSKLKDLRRIEVGQLRNLVSISGFLEAPNLEELLLIKQIGVTAEEFKTVNSHSSLKSFDWQALDVPNKVWTPVVEAVQLPKAKTLLAEEWFDQNTLSLKDTDSMCDDLGIA